MASNMQPHKESVLCDQEETGATIFLPAVFFLGNFGIICWPLLASNALHLDAMSDSPTSGQKLELEGLKEKGFNSVVILGA